MSFTPPRRSEDLPVESVIQRPRQLPQHVLRRSIQVHPPIYPPECRWNATTRLDRRVVRRNKREQIEERRAARILQVHSPRASHAPAARNGRISSSGNVPRPACPDTCLYSGTGKWNNRQLAGAANVVAFLRQNRRREPRGTRVIAFAWRIISIISVVVSVLHCVIRAKSLTSDQILAHSGASVPGPVVALRRLRGTRIASNTAAGTRSQHSSWHAVNWNSIRRPNFADQFELITGVPYPSQSSDRYPFRWVALPLIRHPVRKNTRGNCGSLCITRCTLVKLVVDDSATRWQVDGAGRKRELCPGILKFKIRVHLEVVLTTVGVARINWVHYLNGDPLSCPTRVSDR